MKKITQIIAFSFALYATASMASSSNAQQDKACIIYGKIAQQVWRAKRNGLTLSQTIEVLRTSFSQNPPDEIAGLHLARMIYVDQPELSEMGAIKMALMECDIEYQK